MKKIPMVLLFSALILVSAVAEAQTPMRVRGTIIALEGNVLVVKSRDGKDLKITLADNAAVATAKAITLADLKPGDYVGVTSQKHPDGTLVAREVHTIARTVPEGHIPWDLEPGAMMTNATIEATVQSAKGRVLTLKYKDGVQKIVVPEDVPIVTSVPADRAALVPGEYVFTSARMDADGRLTAARVQVSKDGVKPPQ